MRYASGIKKRAYKSKRGGKRKIVRKALAKSWKKSVSKVVKRVLSNKVEKKIQVYQFGMQPQTLQLTTSSVAGNYQIVSPGNNTYLNISQSTSAGSNNTRIGNEVSTVKLTLDYVLYPNSYNATTNPDMFAQEVLIYFFKIKGASNDTFDTTYLAQFYENGSNTQHPTGYLMDICSKMNGDTFTYLTHRRHKLGRAIVGSAANLTLGNYNSTVNNDFKYNVVGKINLTQYCPKKIVWTDGQAQANVPVIHMLVQTISATGSVQSTSILPISMFGKVEYTYTDM